MNLMSRMDGKKTHTHVDSVVRNDYMARKKKKTATYEKQYNCDKKKEDISCYILEIVPLIPM